MERAKRVPAKRSLIGTNDVLLQQHPRIRTELASALGIPINQRQKGQPPLSSRDRQERASQRFPAAKHRQCQIGPGIIPPSKFIACPIAR